MTASYLFPSGGLVALARYVRPDTLFTFNLDGMLAPDVVEHSAARMAEPVKMTLQRLMNVAKVTVITGRSRKDALAILGFEPHLLIGNHGAEWPSQGCGRNWRQIMLCLKWRERLYDMLNEAHGVEIEFKGESISLHYQKADDPEKALALIHAAIEELDPSLRKIGGKYVVNLLPSEAPTKGEALLAVMEHFGSKRAVYLGDNETDEEVFRLKRADVFGINIREDAKTAASHYLRCQSELLGLINSIVGLLETHCKMEKHDLYQKNEYDCQ